MRDTVGLVFPFRKESLAQLLVHSQTTGTSRFAASLLLHLIRFAATIVFLFNPNKEKEDFNVIL